MSSAIIRPASDELDIVTVAEMWTRASVWLQRQGSDQWQYPVRLENIRKAAKEGACWLIERGSEAIGTVTVDESADEFYWPPEELPKSALYVHRMVTAEKARGMALGTAMLDWAGQKAQEAGKIWLRLDAWRSNTRLHQYYLDHEFRLVRIVEDTRTGSGACFERPATIQLERGPKLQERSADTPNIHSGGARAMRKTS